MSKDYKQFCGLAKAARLLGERWTLLVLRDLSIQPQRFKDLHEGLAGVPTSLLTARLRELEVAGVIERQAATYPDRGVLYGLSNYGQELQPVLDALGRWGAKRMAEPQAEDTITNASLAAALRTAYRPGVIDEARTYLVHAGPATAWATATADEVSVGTGLSDSTPDVTIHAGPGLRLLLAGQVTPDEALTSGDVEIEGSAEIFRTFSDVFYVPLEESHF